MAAFFVSVNIILILFILLFERIDLKLILKDKLTLTFSGTLFSVTLSHFSKRKKRRRRPPSFPAVARATGFLLGHGELDVRALPSPPDGFPVFFGAYEAVISFLLAYSDTVAGKLFLPLGYRSEKGTEVLDVRLRVRLWAILCSFVIYKVNAAARRSSRV